MRITRSDPVLAVHDLELSGAWYRDVLGGELEDVDEFHRRPIAVGAEVLKPPTDEPWGMRELALRSPDGHRFTLGQTIPPR